jgi:hypothetical protein
MPKPPTAALQGHIGRQNQQHFAKNHRYARKTMLRADLA